MVLLQQISVVSFFLALPGLAEIRAGRPLAGKLHPNHNNHHHHHNENRGGHHHQVHPDHHQRPFKFVAPRSADWVGCKNPGYNHVALPNGGYACRRTEEHCSGTFVVVNGHKQWKCCPPNTYYQFNKDMNLGDCCAPRSQLMIDTQHKKAACCLPGNKYFFSPAIGQGRCCYGGTALSADVKTKTGACCPVGKPWNGTSCSGVTPDPNSVCCAAHQRFDPIKKLCVNVCKPTEYYCLTTKKCMTCAEGTRYDVSKKSCTPICKPNVEFWCAKQNKCLVKKPCSDGEKCCSICDTNTQKWCANTQKCIPLCPTGQAALLGKCIPAPAVNTALCASVASKKVRVRCPGPACFMNRNEEFQMAFGPNGTWFFNIRTIPGARIFHGMPAALNTLLSKGGARHFIDDLSFSPCGQWFVTISDGDNHFWRASDIKRYPELERWLKESPKFNLRTLRVTLGSDGAFFAYHDKGFRWHGFDNHFNRLDEHVQWLFNNRFTMLPHHLSIGTAKTWAITSKNGMHYRATNSLYPTLDCIMKQTPHGNIAYVSMNPFHPDEHFVLFTDMSVSWKTSGNLATQVLRLNKVIASTKAKTHAITGGKVTRMRFIDPASKPKPMPKPKMRIMVKNEELVDRQYDDHHEQEYFEMDHHEQVPLDDHEHSAEHHVTEEDHDAGHEEHHSSHAVEFGLHEEHVVTDHDSHIDDHGLEHHVMHHEVHTEDHELPHDHEHDIHHEHPPQATHTEEHAPEFAAPPAADEHAAEMTDVPHMMHHVETHDDHHDQHHNEHHAAGHEYDHIDESHHHEHVDDHDAHDFHHDEHGLHEPEIVLEELHHEADHHATDHAHDHDHEHAHEHDHAYDHEHDHAAPVDHHVDDHHVDEHMHLADEHAHLADDHSHHAADEYDIHHDEGHHEMADDHHLEHHYEHHEEHHEL